MIDGDAIRKVIVEVLFDENRDPMANYNIARGLLWALLGKLPDISPGIRGLLDAAGIPYATDGQAVMVGPCWQITHGLVPDMANWEAIQGWTDANTVPRASMGWVVSSNPPIRLTTGARAIHLTSEGTTRLRDALKLAAEKFRINWPTYRDRIVANTLVASTIYVERVGTNTEVRGGNVVMGDFVDGFATSMRVMPPGEGRTVKTGVDVASEDQRAAAAAEARFRPLMF